MAIENNGWPWARIAIRTADEDGRALILGVNHGCFKPGQVYEIIGLSLGMFVVREVGHSLASLPNGGFEGEERDPYQEVGVCWGRTASDLVRDGRYLITREERVEKYGTPLEILALAAREG